MIELLLWDCTLYHPCQKSLTSQSSWIILIRAFSDFTAFLYILIGGFSRQSKYIKKALKSEKALKPPIRIYKKALKSEKALKPPIKIYKKGFKVREGSKAAYQNI